MSTLTRRTVASRQVRPPKHKTPAWKIIVFVKGERIMKDVREPKEGLEKVSSLSKKGYKAHLVSKRKVFFPPEDDDLSALNDGQLWCPYCRRWRWFSVPAYKEGAEIGTEQWFLNSFSNQEIPCCQWCTITTSDWHVKYMNGLFHNDTKRRRRRRART